MASSLCSGKGIHALHSPRRPQKHQEHSGDVATRHSALGNSFHLPSFAMVLCILLSCVVPFAPLPAMCDPAECFIASRVSHTVFHPGVCQSCPGCVSADDAALAFYKHCSSQGLGLGQCPSRLASALRSLDLASLQCFWVDQCMHGCVSSSLGPDFAQQRAPAATALASGLQRGTGLSKWSLPPLHASGLSKEEHILDSARVPSAIGSLGSRLGLLCSRCWPPWALCCQLA